MPAKPFEIVKVPPPLKPTSALAKERGLSQQETTAIKRFASKIRVLSDDHKSGSSASSTSPRSRKQQGKSLAVVRVAARKK